MRKIYLYLLVCALQSCSGRETKQTVAPQPRQETPTPTNTPPPSQGSDSNIETDETMTGTQNGGGTNQEILDPNGGKTESTTPSTDNTSVKPPSDIETPVTTPSTETPPPTPETPPSTVTAGPGNINIQGSAITFQDIQFTVPAGWTLHQDTYTDGTLIIAFQKGADYFRLYAKQGQTPTLQSIFVNGSNVVGTEKDQTIAEKTFKRIETQKGQVFVSGFSLNHKNHAYYGFGRSDSTAAASAVATEFLNTFK